MRNTMLLIAAMAVFFSCAQPSQANLETTQVLDPEVETVNSARDYRYADAMGKGLVIQNSLPRGVQYIDPTGTEYSRLLFWTRITNATENPLALKIEFLEEAYEIPTLPGKYFHVMLPPDTMTPEQAPLLDYGIQDLKSKLDKSMHQPPSLYRTIPPKEATGFYVVLLFDPDIPGPTRTGLSIKGQDLVYKVTRYGGKQGGSFVDEREIDCGSIDWKNLVRMQ